MIADNLLKNYIARTVKRWKNKKYTHRNLTQPIPLCRIVDVLLKCLDWIIIIYIWIPTWVPIIILKIIVHKIYLAQFFNRVIIKIDMYISKLH